MEDQCTTSIFINHNLIIQQQDAHISEVAGSSNNDDSNIPSYFYLKTKLLDALSSVGAIYKPYTFKEVLSLLKAYIFEKKALDPEDSRFVLCSNTDLGRAFGVDRFEYSQVSTLISQNLNIASNSKFYAPKVPDIQSGPESEYSYQGYVTAQLGEDSDCDEETEYELATESETEIKDPNDSESDVESIILIVGLGESENSDEEWFADESDSSSSCGSESEENSTDDERDQWSCVSCGIKNKPFMRYCQKCWKVRKDWYPEPPKRRRKRKTRPKKDKKKLSLEQKNLENPKLCSIEKGSAEAIPFSELERTSSTASSCTVSSTSSSSSLFTLSSQDSGFSSQDLNSFEVISVRKRKNSDAEEEKKKARTVFESNDDSVKKISQKLKKFSSSVAGQRWLNSSKAKELLDMLGDVSSDSDTDDLTSQGYCTLCYTRPKNASIIHGRLSHIGFCYPCAKRLFNSKAKCPICRRKIHMITKNSYV